MTRWPDVTWCDLMWPVLMSCYMLLPKFSQFRAGILLRCLGVAWCSKTGWFSDLSFGHCTVIITVRQSQDSPVFFYPACHIFLQDSQDFCWGVRRDHGGKFIGSSSGLDWKVQHIFSKPKSKLRSSDSRGNSTPNSNDEKWKKLRWRLDPLGPRRFLLMVLMVYSQDKQMVRSTSSFTFSLFVALVLLPDTGEESLQNAHALQSTVHPVAFLRCKHETLPMHASQKPSQRHQIQNV